MYNYFNNVFLKVLMPFFLERKRKFIHSKREHLHFVENMGDPSFFWDMWSQRDNHKTPSK